MRIQSSQIAWSVMGMLVASSAASGQTLTSRYSQVNFNYVYGGGGDSHTGGDNVEDTALLLSDSEQTDYAGETSGVLPGDPPSPYTAGVAVGIEHEYSIVGSLDAFQSINASGTTLVQSAVSGAGVATMNSSNNGNHVILYFTVDNPMTYRLVGSVMATEPGFATAVSLQRFDGIVWAYVFTSIFLPGSEGPFDVSGPLTPGDYRISGSIGLNAFATETSSGSFNFDLSIHTKGDMNCDGLVDGLDVYPFAKAILGPTGYETDYPICNLQNGDISGDSLVDTMDLAPFVDCVMNGGC